MEAQRLSVEDKTGYPKLAYASFIFNDNISGINRLLILSLLWVENVRSLSTTIRWRQSPETVSKLSAGTSRQVHDNGPFQDDHEN